ncbi:Bifunctional riboflavin biosynthesis protein RIBA 1 [Arabidopsis thaliana]|uniref:Bifunctional riboflavin biosynthesis protein RIBA 1, chloroplastic n=5 Tax=Arabidopsis TaxID=3701 RepID=RIBA1_ARATH|nr:GTP cyclohydrolase II [Arabidopsis thaliana]P47924.2 RecName: Full=Bifunctional riboflavin biosynthesis protein RIBA 1, chloroplastic; Short=AtRIBA1; Includes: RecName: Full=3,4-dihydroxy-2-butanone 4-phosphate synthase; Short=DHBP synthase; Includes: RecName: Full=GTP cyclohydrolase-2; AltName: Full=GTP cyclohydrolase II; Flags: Precursor [Arabidopsis thaliana]KAG7607239.1 GTP cyclohydrolase II RibA [Arabidopsis thaliana x Arabidopsis arenosa]KAG7614145.1 GTP cyclohydrolase II RibA [Arabidop|eukprot:NP_201235.4 GTP cyclohydrolase II [Arabidopsis thaliana]
MSSINLSSSSPSTISLSRSRLSQSSTTLLHGLHRVTLPSNHPLSTFSIKTNTGKVKAAVISREDDLLSFTNGNTPLSNGSLIDDRTEEPLEADSVSLGTLAADSAPAPANGFVAEDDDFELDLPTPGFSSIPEAIEDIRQGKLVVVVDDEDRENEGDLVMAAQLATPEAMAFIVRHGTGIVCVSMKEDDLERLHLPLMVNQKENEEKLSTAFTVTVDAKHGTTTGVSARDRATTILSLASRDSKPEDFNRPGHIFPLKYREGGVLKRAGHTEASVDLTVLAGLDPVGVLCEIVDDDGSMARLPKLREFAAENNLKVVSIADLIRYRRKRDKLVERASAARIPTMWGPFTAYCYRSILDGIEHIAMVKGEIGDGQDILVRVHSECLTGDIFGSARCDCGNQLALSMQQIEATGRGVLVYLRGHEGRGIGLGHKLRAYNLQDAGRDTVEANEELGLPVDSREYGIGAQIIRDLGVRTMKLMTNNPAKYVGLKGYGLAIVGRVPLLSLITKENKRYLETKRTKMGHMYGLKFKGDVVEKIESESES